MKASGSITRYERVAPALMGLLVPLLATALISCEKDEPPPPLPSAAPPPAPPEPEVLTIVEEDAAVDAEEPKKGGQGRSGGSLAGCCAALEQNAANAPEPNATYMKSAAVVCRSAAAAGQTQGAALAGIRAALQSAGMPTACK